MAKALGRGVEQVVLVGAGYDGRALRFGGGTTRWFEVDRPSVLADKDARLRTLGTAAANRRAVAVDLGEAHGASGAPTGTTSGTPSRRPATGPAVGRSSSARGCSPR